MPWSTPAGFRSATATGWAASSTSARSTSTTSRGARSGCRSSMPWAAMPAVSTSTTSTGSAPRDSARCGPSSSWPPMMRHARATPMSMHASDTATPDRLRVTANVLWSRDELGIDREGYGESAQMESRNRYIWLRADRDFGSQVEATLWLGHSTIDSFRKGGIDREDIAVGTVNDQRSSEYRELLGRDRLAARRASLARGRLRMDRRERRLPLCGKRHLHAGRRGTVRPRSGAAARDDAETRARARRALCRLPLAGHRLVDLRTRPSQPAHDHGRNDCGKLAIRPEVQLALRTDARPGSSGRTGAGSTRPTRCTNSRSRMA